ncbi:hypothetical protein POJ06DRAFT_263933 [Lipomyces tetrasporus]|uniref:HTH APSES-type domain-containing protein n=1 Tax=Lipomyces tetrasporus TaxID=54092 RepID=A0AAD7QKJ1_9ASCO|nr:uncharacterized protein POJ06DRAFT_263933 [Lipomyces tetrasporus]KAJ8096585.1 hypothetical protein POJ06DRAFT_263933 [Lipomyces tetrasporus]
MALHEHNAADVSAALVSMARLGAGSVPVSMPGLGLAVAGPASSASSSASTTTTTMTMTPSIQLPSIATISGIARPKTHSPAAATPVRKSSKLAAAKSQPSSSMLPTPSSLLSSPPIPTAAGAAAAAARPKPRRASAAVQHDESQHAVNFPANPFDPATMLPPEHASQIPPGPFTIVRKRYATSVDERHFLTVFEYMVNDQWIMWDYFSGYVHLTGLWKAIGNTKADIVKLVDNSPDLEPVIRRVRGGFLKIQGTWLPFTIARTLASRTCYHIRFALIPLFGPDFPDSCLKPDEPGFGQLQLTLTDSTRRRRKRIVHEGEDQHQPKRRHSKPTDEHRWPSSPGAFAPNGLPTPLPSSSPSAPVPAPVPMAYSLASPTTHAFAYQTPASAPRQGRPHRSLSSPAQSSAGPLKLDFLEHSSLVSSRSEFLDALQATKSLQLLSAGVSVAAMPTRSRSDGAIGRYDGSYLSTQDTEDDYDDEEGREFECGGVLWRWDGKQELNVVGYSDERVGAYNDVVLFDRQQPRTVPRVSDVGGLLSFARVAEERESAERSQRNDDRDHDRDTPGLSDGSASPEDAMIRTLSDDTASPRLRMFGTPLSTAAVDKKPDDVRNVMDISGLLS